MDRPWTRSFMSIPQRYKLTLAYDGTHFHGWQKQQMPGEPPLRTVQSVLEMVRRDTAFSPVVCPVRRAQQ